MRGLKKYILLTIILFLSLYTPSLSIQASGLHEDSIENEVAEGNNNQFSGTSPWLKGSDDSIYSNPVDAGKEEQDIQAKSPGRVEKYFAELLRNIGSSLISLLQDNIGASLDNIIYGRVGSGQPNKVNIYNFELRKGNPYGVTAAVCYGILRGMIFIFLAISFVFQLAKAAWSGQTAKSRDEIKSMFPDLIYKFSILMLMPYLLDVALYVRDILLYGIKEVTGQMITGGATLSLSKAFLMNAERSGTFVDAIMYLGSVALTVYFVFVYVALAIDMLVCFISFPFLCNLQSKKRDFISSWIMTAFSNIITPVIDAVLLLIPLLTSLMLSDTIKGVAIIQLVMCMLIIPTRSRFKALMGVQSNERNGFMGVMAGMALAKAVAGRIKKGIGNLTDAFSDVKKSRMHGELAEVDKEEESAYLSGHDGKADGGNNMLPEELLGLPEEREQKEEDPYAELKNNKDMTGTEEGLPSGKDSIEDDDRPEIPENKTGDTGQEEDSATGLSSDNPIQSRNDLLRNLNQEAAKSQENIDGLKVERAALVQKEKDLKSQMLNYDKGSPEYKRLEKARADIDKKTAEVDGKITKENQKFNRLRQQSKELHAAMGIRSTPTIFGDKRAEILQKRANISNFEQPEFKGVLTNEQMKDLYRKRAVSNVSKAAISTVGAVAAGTVFGGSAVFLGSSTVAMAASGGIQAGGAAGEAAVDVALEAGRTVQPVARKAGRSAYRAADMAASAYLMNKIRPAAMQADTSWAKMPEPSDIPANEDDPIKKFPKSNPFGEGLPEHNPKSPPITQKQMQTDASYAISQIFDIGGNMKNSTALRIMKQANLEAEKAIAVMKEEKIATLNEKIIREKRITLQTEALSGEILKQMESLSSYEKGTENYKEAKQMICERVRKILEEKNRPLL